MSQEPNVKCPNPRLFLCFCPYISCDQGGNWGSETDVTSTFSPHGSLLNSPQPNRLWQSKWLHTRLNCQRCRQWPREIPALLPVPRLNFPFLLQATAPPVDWEQVSCSENLRARAGHSPRKKGQTAAGKADTGKQKTNWAWWFTPVSPKLRS